MRNNLPPYWYVWNTGDPEFKEVVIKYMHRKYGMSLKIKAFSNYYGFDGDIRISNQRTRFKNNAIELRIEQFKDLIKPVPLLKVSKWWRNMIFSYE